MYRLMAIMIIENKQNIKRTKKKEKADQQQTQHHE